jgi:HK97 family phage major capsid protein
LLSLANTLDGSETRFAEMRVNQAKRELGLPCESRLLRFFRKQTPEKIYFDSESRDMGVGTGAGAFGSPLTPPLFRDRVLQTMKQYDQLFDVATWIPTATGGKFSIPSMNDIATSAVMVSENAQNAENDFTDIAAVNFGQSPMWRTGSIKVSLELLQDSGVDLEQLFADRFGVRFARGLGPNLVALVKANASVGKTTASPSAIAPDELYELVGSLDPAYAASPSCGWLLNYSTLIAILKMRAGGSTSSDGPYLFHLKADANGHPTLLEKRVYVCPSMDSIGSSAIVIGFGELSRVLVRHVKNTFSMKRFDERFIDYGQVLYQAYWRLDGQFAKAGSGSDAPIVLMKMHS